MISENGCLPILYLYCTLSEKYQKQCLLTKKKKADKIIHSFHLPMFTYLTQIQNLSDCNPISFRKINHYVKIKDCCYEVLKKVLVDLDVHT